MDIKQKVFDVIKQLSFSEQISESSRLQEDIGLDSLNMVNLLLELEEAFDIILDESSMNPFDLNTVYDVISLVSKYCGDKNA